MFGTARVGLRSSIGPVESPDGRKSEIPATELQQRLAIVTACQRCTLIISQVNGIYGMAIVAVINE